MARMKKSPAGWSGAEVWGDTLERPSASRSAMDLVAGRAGPSMKQLAFLDLRGKAGAHRTGCCSKCGSESFGPGICQACICSAPHDQH